MKKHTTKKVFVGLSGGVDSSVAALLLKRRGFEVVGIFMRCYNLDGCAEQDALDARRVAEKIGIPFYVWDLEEEYKKRVVNYMIAGYRAGLTPNPDVMCNREIKFGLFLEKALKLGADFVATGHYVQKIGINLFAAKDKNKDQSYFLWTLSRENIKRSLFPIGPLEKSEVRSIARKAGLPTAVKKDSQGICFMGQVTLKDFLKLHLPVKTGAIVTVSGEKIGEHEGSYFYTIGQRHGLNLKEKNQLLGRHTPNETLPHYVAHKKLKENIIVVAEGEDNPALTKKEVFLSDINLSFPLKNKRTDVWVRVRYRQPVFKATLEFNSKKATGKLIFASPQKFIAPGQSAVFYGKNRQLLGGGVIL